jgi:hypothetical protein
MASRAGCVATRQIFTTLATLRGSAFGCSLEGPVLTPSRQASEDIGARRLRQMVAVRGKSREHELLTFRKLACEIRLMGLQAIMSPKAL